MSEDRGSHESRDAALHQPGEHIFSEYALSSGNRLVIPPVTGGHDHESPVAQCNTTVVHGQDCVGREFGWRYEIMVDGSGDGHSIALFPGEEVYFSYERGASNNDAEFNAVILALQNLPPRAHARISTDSQVVVWHLSAPQIRRNATYTRKKAQIEDLISSLNLKVEIQWIPRKENRADRFLKHYIASLCGAQGREPLHHRVRRLESENLRLKARLRKAMKLLENRPVVIRDEGIQREGIGMGVMLIDQ